MSYKTFTTAALILAAATPTFAQEIAGASVGAFYTAPLDNDVDSDLFSLKAGIELALPGSFSLGGNIATFNDSEADDTGFNATLHGMYMVSPDATVGMFVSRDTEGDFDYDTWGVEGGGAVRGTSFEAYYGVIDGLVTDPGIDTSMAGASVAFAAGQNFAITVGFDSVTATDGTVSSSISATTLGGSYQFAGGPSVFAEIGQVSLSVDTGSAVFVSEDPAEFISLGVEMNFGRNSGNLLGNRSIYNALGY